MYTCVKKCRLEPDSPDTPYNLYGRFGLAASFANPFPRQVHRTIDCRAYTLDMMRFSTAQFDHRPRVLALYQVEWDVADRVVIQDQAMEDMYIGPEGILTPMYVYIIVEPDLQ